MQHIVYMYVYAWVCMRVYTDYCYIINNTLWLQLLCNHIYLSLTRSLFHCMFSQWDKKANILNRFPLSWSHEQEKNHNYFCVFQFTFYFPSEKKKKCLKYMLFLVVCLLLHSLLIIILSFKLLLAYITWFDNITNKHTYIHIFKEENFFFSVS